MTDTTTRPEHRVDPREEERKPALGLSGAQIIGGALAATSSALVASFFGIAGTLIGAALGSVIATVGTALYTATLRQATGRIRTGVRGPASPGAARGGATAVETADAADEEALRGASTFRSRGRKRLRLGLGTLAAFLLAIAGITAAEAMLGHPISTSKTSGTSVGSVVTPRSATPRPEVSAPDPEEATAPEGDPTPAPAPAPGETTGPADPGQEGTPGPEQPTDQATGGEPTPQGPRDGRDQGEPTPQGDAGRPGPAPDGDAPAAPDAPEPPAATP